MMMREPEETADELRDVLRRNGFVRCDIAACNCGSWHARFGLPERMAEVRQALEDAGHGLSNENGNLVSKALAGLISERDALRKVAERYDWLTDGKRDDWIWNHVLNDDDKALGNWTHEVIDARIAQSRAGV